MNNNTSDIFISYRREGGEHLAGRIWEALQSRGYKVFMDVENLKNGKFTLALLNKIDEATDFILILTPGCLNRCINENDWLRIEIAHAIRQQKNIIPVIASGFEMPKKSDLPNEIAELTEYNGLIPANQLFEQSIEKLSSEFLISEKTIKTTNKKIIPIPEKRKILSDKLNNINLVEKAAELIETGESRLDFAAIKRFNFLELIDPLEIDQACAIQKAIETQVATRRNNSILKIAVSAPTGMGKVFAIQQIARSVDPKLVYVIEIDLSSFSDPKELTQYFRNTQDLVLKGQLPILFIDGIDLPLGNNKLGWIQYLKSIVQNGEFLDDNISRPLGSCILCLMSQEIISPKQFETIGNNSENQIIEKFVSHIDYYYDISGINPLWSDDNIYILKRALILNKILMINGHKYKLDNPLQKALLTTPIYYNHIRSLLSLIKSLQPLKEERLFTTDSLPSDSVINNHTDAINLRKLLQNN